MSLSILLIALGLFVSLVSLVVRELNLTIGDEEMISYSMLFGGTIVALIGGMIYILGL